MTIQEAAAEIAKIKEGYELSDRYKEALNTAAEYLKTEMVPLEYHEKTLLLEVKRRINAEKVIKECLKRKKPAAALICTFGTGLLAGLALYGSIAGYDYTTLQWILCGVVGGLSYLEISKL